MSMNSELKVVTQAAVAALFLLFLAPRLFACSSITLEGLPSSFVIKILDSLDRPSQNLELLLLSHGKEVRRLRTDGAGTLELKDLPVGAYTLSRVILADSYPLINLNVVPSKGLLSFPLVLRLPGDYVTSNLSGTLRFWKLEPPSQRSPRHDVPLIETAQEVRKGYLVGVKLELFQAESAKKTAETTTNEAGQFEFPVTEPGSYVMKFRFENRESWAVLELDRASAVSVLDLWLRDSGFLASGRVNAWRNCGESVAILSGTK